MLNLFNRRHLLLEEETIEWIFNCYAWALEQFDRNVFFNETTLVIPDNSHFPGREQSVEGMANLIFDQVKQYAGLAHWPTQLINQSSANQQILGSQLVKISGASRGKNAINDLSDAASTGNSLPFYYDAQQLNSPEGLIAHFALGLSYHLASTAKIPPPGGEDFAPIAGELTGVFLGFGLMFANSAAVSPGGGCGGGCCGGGGPVRQVFLREEEATYALALFCVLKNIEPKKATPHLKKHLRRFLKAAMSDCESRIEKHTHLKLAEALK